jgi:hypothetical protein
MLMFLEGLSRGASSKHLGCESMGRLVNGSFFLFLRDELSCSAFSEKNEMYRQRSIWNLKLRSVLKDDKWWHVCNFKVSGTSSHMAHPTKTGL